MKFYAYRNRKINFLSMDGGEWVRVSFVQYLLLKIFGYIVKKD